jgi:acetyl esterase
MSLDPQIAALLENFRKMRGKPVQDMTPWEARFAGWAWKYLMGDPEPIADVAYHYIPGPSADLPARIYRPAQVGDAAAPALIYFHGGGFVLGNIEICDPFCRTLANRTGCVVVSVNYQKAPEHKYPIAMEDCYATLQWVHQWTDNLRIDPGRIGVIGDSAGGNLAAAVTLKAREAGGPQPRWQVLIYPALRGTSESASAQEHASGYTLERAGMEYFWNHYVRSAADTQDPLCAPLSAESLDGLPPALVICAQYDPLLDDGRDYANRLEAAGVPVHFSEYGGMTHGFLWMGGVVDRASDAFDEIARAADSALS